jgi:ketosteroid isomerase-like protein
MRRLAVSIPMLLLLVAACDPPDRGPPDPLPEDVEPVRPDPGPDVDDAIAIVYDFHHALTVGDSARAIELLHPEAAIFEAGHAETVEEYRGGHLPADMEFAREVEREVVHERVIPVGDGVLYLAEIRARGTFRGRSIDSQGVETVVLVPADGEWRITHVHWSSR